MVALAKDFEKHLKAMGPGSFSRIEYDDGGNVVLRTSDMKSSDVSGVVRVYFDSRRAEVMTGRRFEPMGNLWLLQRNTVYRMYSHLSIDTPLPEGVSALVVPTEDAKDVLAILDRPIGSAFTGIITFTVLPYRKVEMESMTSVARLMFFDDRLRKSGSVKDATGTTGRPKNHTKG